MLSGRFCLNMLKPPLPRFSMFKQIPPIQQPHQVQNLSLTSEIHSEFDLLRWHQGPLENNAIYNNSINMCCHQSDLILKLVVCSRNLLHCKELLAMFKNSPFFQMSSSALFVIICCVLCEAVRLSALEDKFKTVECLLIHLDLKL